MFIYNQSEAGNQICAADNTSAHLELKETFSARVYFSNEVPVDGLAKEGELFYIKPEGSFLYLIIDNYPDPIRYNKVRVYVYKSIGGAAVKIDEANYNIDGSFYLY
jgi:hypothetical protein